MIPPARYRWWSIQAYVLLLLLSGCGISGPPQEAWEKPRDAREALLYVAAETKAIMLTVDDLHRARTLSDAQALRAADEADKIAATVRGGVAAFSAGDAKTADEALLAVRASLHMIRTITRRSP